MRPHCQPPTPGQAAPLAARTQAPGAGGPWDGSLTHGPGTEPRLEEKACSQMGKGRGRGGGGGRQEGKGSSGASRQHSPLTTRSHLNPPGRLLGRFFDLKQTTSKPRKLSVSQGGDKPSCRAGGARVAWRWAQPGSGSSELRVDASATTGLQWLNAGPGGRGTPGPGSTRPWLRRGAARRPCTPAVVHAWSPLQPQGTLTRSDAGEPRGHHATQNEHHTVPSDRSPGLPVMEAESKTEAPGSPCSRRTQCLRGDEKVLRG